MPCARAFAVLPAHHGGGYDMDYREGLRGVRGVLLWGLFFLTIAVLLAGRHARAGDPQFWGSYPPEVHEWVSYRYAAGL